MQWFQSRLVCLPARLLAILAGMTLLSGCGSGEPFSYVHVTGTVTYEDGTPIPVTEMQLTFFPQSDPIDKATFPCPGATVVDVATGAFSKVTSHRFDDGLIPGKHKVTITKCDKTPLPKNLVPIEYADVKTTPLIVDTTVQPFDLKVQRPQKK